MALAFKDAYPPEIVEWATSEEFAPDNLTPERERILAILEDEEMMRAAKKFMRTKIELISEEHPRTVRDCEYIEAFRYFIEDAARLLDKQPPGSHLRYARGEPLMFSTPGELKQDLAKGHALALEMPAIIERTAASLGGRFTSADAYQLINLLDSYYEAVVTTAAEYVENEKIDREADTCPETPKDRDGKAHKGTPEIPGSKAGKNGMRNWLMHEVGLVANLHLRDNPVSLVIEVARILLQQNEPTEQSTARDYLPNTQLVPAEGEWAPEGDWRANIKH